MFIFIFFTIKLVFSPHYKGKEGQRDKKKKKERIIIYKLLDISNISYVLI